MQLNVQRQLTSSLMAETGYVGNRGVKLPLQRMFNQVDRITGMSFYLPGFHAGIDYTSVPSDHPTRAGERLRTSHVFHAVTPGLKNTTHYFFGMGGLMTEADLDYLYGYLRSVVEEDAFATTEIEHILGNLGYVPDELMLRSDTTAVLGRRALQSLMEKEGQV